MSTAMEKAFGPTPQPNWLVHPVTDFRSIEPYFDDLTRACRNLITAGPEADFHQLLSTLVDKVFTCSGAYHLALELEKGGAQ